MYCRELVCSLAHARVRTSIHLECHTTAHSPSPPLPSRTHAPAPPDGDRRYAVKDEAQAAKAMGIKAPTGAPRGGGSGGAAAAPKKAAASFGGRRKSVTETIDMIKARDPAFTTADFAGQGTFQMAPEAKMVEVRPFLAPPPAPSAPRPCLLPAPPLLLSLSKSEATRDVCSAGRTALRGTWRQLAEPRDDTHSQGLRHRNRGGSHPRRIPCHEQHHHPA